MTKNTAFRVTRRALMGTGIGLAATTSWPLFAQSDRSSITVALNEAIGTNSPDLYGYLLENLGNAIYDGIWVGPNSSIANINGIRKSLVEHMRELGGSLIRWPGGNYADYYDWRDGVGPRSERPTRANFWSDYMQADAPAGPQRYDPNHFGTPEFMELCRLTGGTPFLNLNVRSMNSMESAQWVDYCNAPAGSTSWARQREADGSTQPYGVDYWGIGNEPWAYGGNMTAEDYAAIYRNVVQGLPSFGRSLKLIAAGGPPTYSNTDWTRTFLEECKGILPVPVAGLSIHHYWALPQLYQKPGESFEEFMGAKDDRPKSLVDPIGYSPFEWYRILSDCAALDGIVKAHWDTLEDVSPGRDCKLSVDEWGGIFSGRLGEVSKTSIRARAVPLRDALGVAITLDVLQRYCDKILNANFTGLINQEGGVFQAEGDKFVATPVYHVLRMYRDHHGAQSLRTRIECPDIHSADGSHSVSVPALLGSASRIGKRLTLTVVNPDVSRPREADIHIPGAAIASAHATVLTHADIQAQNTFENPLQVAPKAHPTRLRGSNSVHVFPPRSVTKLSIMLV